jgi:enoyl-[acyl-carrier protein] reductase II
MGVDGVIAEGMESGGHIGELTTMALVPQVVDALQEYGIPVIAAGGIADGRQLLAAFSLGACGVQLGTCLLASEECPVHDNYKQAVLKAKETDTVVTGRLGGTPVRMIKNRMSRAYLEKEKAGADKIELELFTLGSLKRAVFEGDVETGSVMAGQVAGMIHEIRPLEHIFASLYNGYEAALRSLVSEAHL